MASPKSSTVRQHRAKALADTRRVLKNLKEIGRWQMGLVDQLERAIEQMEALQKPASPSRQSI